MVMRRSLIEYSGGDVSIEDLIADENVVITISHAGYIKRTNLTEYKTQNRGSWSKKCRNKRSRFLGTHVCSYESSIYDVLYPKGKCFWMRVYEIPEGSKTAKGRVQNLINIESDDKVKAFICTQDLKTKIIKSHNLIMVTKKRSG
jgi:DNA gyrase subunit A